MSKKPKNHMVIFVGVFIFLIAILLIGQEATITGEAKGGKPGGGGGGKPGGSSAQCNDHIDNDGDGYCDFAWKKASCSDGSIPGDSDCSSKDDNSEAAACVPITEVCDGVDNDCDGQIDESLVQPCGSSNVGSCEFGTQTCNNGAWGACNGNVEPTTEVCDSVDNDCDGSIDDNLQQQCGTSDVGVCEFGLQTCTFGTWGLCNGSIDASTEVCDSLDNDCDGVTDDGCNCLNGQTQDCGSDVGACAFGTQTCAGGQWGACVGETGPATEVCNSVDDDCNGNVDDSLPIACSFNGDCGSNGYIGSTYCGGDANVYRDWQSFNCNNAATCGSSCSNQITAVLYNICSNGCSDGICLPGGGNETNSSG